MSTKMKQLWIVGLLAPIPVAVGWFALIAPAAHQLDAEKIDADHYEATDKISTVTAIR